MYYWDELVYMLPHPLQSQFVLQLPDTHVTLLGISPVRAHRAGSGALPLFVLSLDLV